VLSRQVLCHFRHVPSLFCFNYFLNRSHVCFAWAASDLNPHTHNSPVAGMIGAHHNAHLLLVERVSL
jgi:hypothetical protein